MDSDISRVQDESEGFVHVLEKKQTQSDSPIHAFKLRATGEKIKLMFAKAVLYCKYPF